MSGGVGGSAPSIQIRISTLSGTLFGHFSRPGPVRVEPARQSEASRREGQERPKQMDVRETRYQAGDIFAGAVTFPIAKAGADTRSCRIVNPRKEFQISKE